MHTRLAAILFLAFLPITGSVAAQNSTIIELGAGDTPYDNCSLLPLGANLVRYCNNKITSSVIYEFPPYIISMKSLNKYHAISINKSGYYNVDLEILFSGKSQREKAINLIGDATNFCQKLNNCGVFWNVKLKIYNEKKEAIFDSYTKSYGQYGFSEAYFMRTLFDLNLDKGLYYFKFEASPFNSGELESRLMVRQDPRAL